MSFCPKRSDPGFFTYVVERPIASYGTNLIYAAFVESPDCTVSAPPYNVPVGFVLSSVIVTVVEAFPLRSLQ